LEQLRIVRAGVLGDVLGEGGVVRFIRVDEDQIAQDLPHVKAIPRAVPTLHFSPLLHLNQWLLLAHHLHVEIDGGGELFDEVGGGEHGRGDGGEFGDGDEHEVKEL
jgi:hypothetical protein